MSLYETWTTIKSMPDIEFTNLCKSILRGLGFSDNKEFYISDTDKIFSDSIMRESTDKLFKSDESWLIEFVRQDIENLPILEFIKRAKSSGAENFLLIVFGNIAEKIQNIIHDELRKDKINSVIICEELVNALIYDYGQNYVKIDSAPLLSLKFLRQSAIKQAKDATWRAQFQTLPALAATMVTSPQGGDEADLFRAISKTGSFLLFVRVQDIVNIFWHEFYFVEGSRHRELDQAAERRVNSGLRRATVSEMS